MASPARSNHTARISNNRGRYRHPWLRRLAWLLTRPMPRAPRHQPWRAAPAGFTVADLTAQAGAMTGQQDYTARQAGYPALITQSG